MKKRKLCTAILLAGLMAGSSGCGGQAANSPEQGTEPAITQESSGSPITLAAIGNGTLVRAVRKEESVSIRTEADGTPTETRVRVQLSGVGEGDYIEDRTDLTDIRNREGDEEFLLDGERLYWEDHGSDIRYEGTSSGELPFAVHITYALDGKEIAPEELAGKSGEVRIRFDYENRTAGKAQAGDRELEMAIPMTAISMAVLPEEVFSDVEVKNGRLISFGGQQIAVGVAMPGLRKELALADFKMTEDLEIPEYVEITAKAEKFKLDFTATVASPGLLSGDDEEDAGNIDSFFDDMKELEDAGGELVDGAAKLYDGAQEFHDGLGKYVDGASSLANGASSLARGAKQLQGQSSQLTEGAKQVADGISALQAGLAQIDTAQLAQLSQIDVSALSATLSGVDLTGMESMIRDSLGEEAAAPVRALASTLSELQTAVQALSALPAAAGQFSQSVTELQSGLGQLSSGASSLASGVAAYTDGVSSLSGGASQLSSGAGQLVSSGKELKDGSAELLDGILEFRDGVAEFDEEGIRELTELVRTDMKNVVDRLRAARKLDAELNNFSGILDGQEGSVRFVFESASI